MINVLITGITGFVGYNLVSSLHKNEKFRLLGHSRDAEKAKKIFDGFKVKIISSAITDETLNDYLVDVVIHLAGIAHDLSGQYKAEDYYKVNFEGTKQVYDEFLKSNASKFIFVSSIKAALDIAREPAREEDAPSPVTDYGKSKLKAEQYIQAMSAVAGKYFYILRPAMIHGPGNKGNLNLLYRFVKAGIPFPFGAFENKRSFLCIDNFAFITQQLLSREIASGVYHLADDGFLSTKELYRVIASSLEKRSRILNVPKSWIQNLASIFGKKHLLNKLTEDMMVSNKKIVNELGVSLPVSLRDGISKTIKSFNG